MAVHPKVAKLVTLVQQAVSGCQVLPSMELPLKTAVSSVARDAAAADYVLASLPSFIRVLQFMVRLRETPSGPYKYGSNLPAADVYECAALEPLHQRLLIYSADIILSLMNDLRRVTKAQQLDILGIMLCGIICLSKLSTDVDSEAATKAEAAVEKSTRVAFAGVDAAGAEESESGVGGSPRGKPMISQCLPLLECVVQLTKLMAPSSQRLDDWMQPHLLHLEEISTCRKREERRGQMRQLGVDDAPQRIISEESEGGRADSDDSDEEEDSDDEEGTGKGPQDGNVSIEQIAASKNAALGYIAIILETLRKDLHLAPDIRPAGAITGAVSCLAVAFLQLLDASSADKLTIAVTTLTDVVFAATVTAASLTKKLPASQDLVEMCLGAATTSLTFLADFSEKKLNFDQHAPLLKAIACATLLPFAAFPYLLATLRSWHAAVLEAEASGEEPRRDGRTRRHDKTQITNIEAALASDLAVLDVKPPPEKRANDFVVRGVTAKGGKAIVASIQEALSSLLSSAMHARLMSAPIDSGLTSSILCSPGAKEVFMEEAAVLDAYLPEWTCFTPAATTSSRLFASCVSMSPAWALDASGIPSVTVDQFIVKSPHLLAEALAADTRLALRTIPSSDCISKTQATWAEVWKPLIAGAAQLPKYSKTTQQALVQSVHRALLCCLLLSKHIPTVSWVPAKVDKLVAAFDSFLVPTGSHDSATFIAILAASSALYRVIPVTQALIDSLVSIVRVRAYQLRSEDSQLVTAAGESTAEDDDTEAENSHTVSELVHCAAVFARLDLAGAFEGHEQLLQAPSAIGLTADLRAFAALPHVFEDDELVAFVGDVMLAVLSSHQPDTNPSVSVGRTL